MRYPFQKPSLSVIVEDLTTLVVELGELHARHLNNASLIRQRANGLHVEADGLEFEAKRAGRIQDRVAELLE